MKKILNARQMKECDRLTIEGGIPSVDLMENAAMALYDEIKKRDYNTENVCILVGCGNNGGDGVALARLLNKDNNMVSLLFSGEKEKYSRELLHQIELIEGLSIPVVTEYKRGQYSLVIDGIFGIGLKREITGSLGDIIDKVNEDGAKKIAIDIPSGINADTGEVMGKALKCDLTVTFDAVKIGHFMGDGMKYTGELVVRDIGIDADNIKEPSVLTIDREDLEALPKRDEGGNKSTFGKILVVAGSEEIFGAAYFSAKGALKAGCGMVRVFTHERNRTPLCVSLPEALIDTYSDKGFDRQRLKNALNWCHVIVAGPGLSTSELSKKLLNTIIELTDKPIILDADALNIISRDRDILKNCKSERIIITPHIGEFSRLTDLSVSEIKKNPIGTALDFARQQGCCCILKDAETVIAYPNGKVFINRTGNSALSTAGSGDILSGIVGAYVYRFKDVQGIEAMGVYVHGLLGEMASTTKSKSGIIASDLLEELNKIPY